MDIFYGYLEAVEKFCLSVLYFGHEVFGKIFIHDAVAGRKKRQYV